MSLSAVLLFFLDLILGRWRFGPVLGVRTLWNMPLSNLLIELPEAVRALLHVHVVLRWYRVRELLDFLLILEAIL